MRLAPGSAFAGYRIERLLGVGGMGVVYLAQHPRLEKWVALKVLNESLAAEPAARARFDREAAVAARLEHPNIVAVLDRNSPEDEYLWLSMPFVDGCDAAALVPPGCGGMDPARAADLIEQAARGLDHAHRMGVIHRDVKPANILVTVDPDGVERALVSDFGLATSLHAAATASSIGGSFAYTAPERFRGEIVDQRSDVYSLGVTLYQLLTGELPYTYVDQAALMAAHLQESPPRLCDLWPELPVGLTEVIVTALAKDPLDRFASCGEMARAVLEAVTPSPEVTGSPPIRPNTGGDTGRYLLPPGGFDVPSGVEVLRSERTRVSAERTRSRPPEGGRHRSQLGRRNLLRAALAAGAIAAVGGVGAIVVRGKSSAGTEPVSTAPALAPVKLDTGRTQGIRALAYSPDGTQLAVGADMGVLQIFGVRDRQRTEVPPEGGTIASLGYSAAGDRLTACDILGTVRHWGIQGGVLQPVGDQAFTKAAVSRVAASPDGSVLAVVANGSVQLYDSTDLHPFGDPFGQKASRLSFSPDGGQLAGVLPRTDGGRNVVTIWDVHSRNVISEWEIAGSAGVYCAAFQPSSSILATGDSEGAIRLWDTRTGAEVGSMQMPGVEAANLVFNSSGSVLASFGGDNTVSSGAGRIWLWNVSDRRAAREPLVIPDRTLVTAAAFSPDGRLLASGGTHGSLYLWKADW
ncbi:WD40 repeat domain-containing serine/threonine protein kinase [Nocardia stercoris]|uniref:WD40 repeat domain-containing serine/threonine protein kinase n=1 Tax=Nocardia stercoris TaxID=2483361 RepID=UPI0011C42280|nr:WD40 repeat domain-containing serine/threonine protein kinase [Nocardia stercoris]